MGITIIIFRLMDNKEGTIMGVGAIAIACLCYFYQQYKEERLEYKAKKKSLEQHCRASTHGPIDYEGIKASGQKQLVLFPAVRQYKVDEASYKSFIRSHKSRFIPPRVMQSLRENQAGGKFQIKDPQGGRSVEVDINDCHIQEEALTEERDKCIVFLDQNRHKNTESTSLSYTLKVGQCLALYGAIGYSLTEQRFVLEPQFIVVSRGDAERVIERLAEFWQEKIYRATFWKLLLAFSIAAVGYTLFYRPIRAMLRRRQELLGEVSKARLHHFGEKSEFRARIDGKLMCEACKNNNVSIIYECGHLCLCEPCHDANHDQRCPVCRKFSNESIKIFL